MSGHNEDTFHHYIRYLTDQAGVPEAVATAMAENLLLRKGDLQQQHYERVKDAYVRVEDKHLEAMGIAAAILPMLQQKAAAEGREFTEVWEELRNLSLGFASGFKRGLEGAALVQHARGYTPQQVLKQVAS